jgi:hypothetical protein
MKFLPALALIVLSVAGCTSAPSDPTRATKDAAIQPANPAVSKAPNWAEIDQTVQRIKEREKSRSSWKITDKVESGFFPMSDEDYASALNSARDEIRKANPKMSDSDVETNAVRRADEARSNYENSFRQRASTTYELEKHN